MRAHFIFEKFTEDSDPIADMGIGMMQQIKDWMETTYYTFENKNQALQVCCYKGKTHFVNYLLEAGANIRYQNDSIIHRLEWDKKPNIKKIILDAAKKIHPEILVMRDSANKIDLIKLYEIPVSKEYVENIIKNIKILSDKLSYAKKYNIKIDLSNEEKLLLSCKAGNYKLFKEAINNGVKIKIGHVNSLFKYDYTYSYSGYTGRADSEKEKRVILDYLKDNIKNLKNIVVLKDLDKIKKLLKIEDPDPLKYPNGYKIYRLLKFIDTNNVTSETEMSKFMYELTHGLNTWNPLTNSSYWKDGFAALVSPRVNKHNSGSKYTLNAKGRADLQKMKNKFGSMKIKSHF